MHTLKQEIRLSLPLYSWQIQVSQVTVSDGWQLKRRSLWLVKSHHRIADLAYPPYCHAAVGDESKYRYAGVTGGIESSWWSSVFRNRDKMYPCTSILVNYRILQLVKSGLSELIKDTENRIHQKPDHDNSGHVHTVTDVHTCFQVNTLAALPDGLPWILACQHIPQGECNICGDP